MLLPSPDVGLGSNAERLLSTKLPERPGMAPQRLMVKDRQGGLSVRSLQDEDAMRTASVHGGPLPTSVS